MKKSNTETLIKAMRILSKDIISEDGIPNAAIAEAADRLEQLERSWNTGHPPAELISFHAYHPDLVHPDWNPAGVVEACQAGDGFIGAVWNGHIDEWETKEIQVAAWKKIVGPC